MEHSFNSTLKSDYLYEISWDFKVIGKFSMNHYTLLRDNFNIRQK